MADNSNGNGQDRLFFDNEYDVLNYTIAKSGKPPKAIAIKVYPGNDERQATSKLSRLLSSECADVPLKWEKIKAILDETTPEYWLRYQSQIFGYVQPEKKRSLTPEEELKLLKSKIKEMQLDEHPNFKGFM